ncbi:MAG: M3 family oligoendopeptidase [Candidatus Dormibacteria bacterium]
MAVAESQSTPVKAAGVRWDLTAIHESAEAARTEMAETLAQAGSFRSRHLGRVAALDAPGLAHLLNELALLTDRIRADLTYSELRNAADSALPENQDLAAAADLAGIQFANLTRFFDLEWQAVPSERVAALVGSPQLAPLRHFLELLSARARHTLSAEVEEALAERSTAAVSAWQQLFGQTTSAITAAFALPGQEPQEHTIDELIVYRHHQDPAVRRAAVETLYGALAPWAPTLARAYDSLVGDRLVIDRLRHFVSSDGTPLPMQQANLANDLPDQVVDTLLDAVQSHYPLAQRYYRFKAGQLGAERLSYYDLLAPMGPVPVCSFPEGRELVLQALGRFSGAAAEILAQFFSQGLIDAEPRSGKRGGAFCESVASDRPAFVLLNYTDTRYDAEVLAHELGHGLHAVLAKRQQSPLAYETGMGLAEVASTFNELLLFDHLLAQEIDPGARRTLVCSRVERSFNTIFNQVSMARYEQRAYAAKQAGESLNSGRLGDFWVAEGTRYYGDAVDLPPGYRLGWSYIPHFIHTRFYTYSYAFALLTSLALYSRYLLDRAGFVPQYLSLLGAGGSQAPAALLLELGIDVSDPGWVEPAFQVVGSWIALAEAGEVASGAAAKGLQSPAAGPPP